MKSKEGDVAATLSIGRTLDGPESIPDVYNAQKMLIDYTDYDEEPWDSLKNLKICFIAIDSKS